MSTYNLQSLQGNVTVPWGMLVQRGNFPTITGWEASGYKSAIGTSFETIWDITGNYTYPASAVPMTVTSAAAGDDEGVEITIIGLDTDYVELVETVTLNASGTATTDASFLRINRAYVSNGSEPTDNVNITNGATTYARITYPYNTTQMAIYTVPKGKTAYLVYASLSLEKQKEVVAKFITRGPDGVFITGGILGTTGSYQRHWEVPVVLPQKTDIEIRALAGATTAISADMQFFIED